MTHKKTTKIMQEKQISASDISNILRAYAEETYERNPGATLEIAAARHLADTFLLFNLR